MFTSLLTGLALAAAPADVDLDDVARWEEAAETILDGPAGCWEMVGQATWEWDVGRWGATRGDAMFVGRLENGVWSEFVVESLGEITREGKRGEETRLYGEEARFAPLVGKLEGRRIRTVGGREAEVAPEDRQSVPENLVRSALDRLGIDVETSWAQWDDAARGVVLHRALPLTDGARAPEARVEVLFPGGDQLPVSLDVIFPDRFYKGLLPRWRLDDAVVHIRGRVSHGKVFPTLESFKFEFGVFGLTFTGAQTIRYKSARRCPTTKAGAAEAAVTAEGASPTTPPPVPEPAPEADPSTPTAPPEAAPVPDPEPQ